MKPRRTRELTIALERKGFRRREGHHTFLIFHVEKCKTAIRTKISHGVREYGQPLLAQMAKQLRLSQHDFERLVECPMSEEEYIAKMTRERHVRR